MLVVRLYGGNSNKIDLDIQLLSDEKITTLHGVNKRLTIIDLKGLIFQKDNRLKPDQMELYIANKRDYNSKKDKKMKN